MTEKMLGKIKSARFGYGGDKYAMLGFSFELGGDNWSVKDFKGYWARHDKYCKWTKADQSKGFANAQEFVRNLLDAAQCTDLEHLVGMAVVVRFDNNKLKSWGILNEVI